MKYDLLQNDMLQYKGEIHDKMNAQLNTLEASLANERDENKSYQNRNAQLEKDVDMLTKLVQNEAKESRARAER